MQTLKSEFIMIICVICLFLFVLSVEFPAFKKTLLQLAAPLVGN